MLAGHSISLASSSEEFLSVCLSSENEKQQHVRMKLESLKFVSELKRETCAVAKTKQSCKHGKRP